MCFAKKKIKCGERVNKEQNQFKEKKKKSRQSSSLVVRIYWVQDVSPQAYNPTNPFTVLELPGPSSDVPEIHKIRRSPDREAMKL